MFINIILTVLQQKRLQARKNKPNFRVEGKKGLTKLRRTTVAFKLFLKELNKARLT